MGIRVVPEETVPLSVARYLWPTERRVITVRKHPAAFRGHALLLIAILAVFGLDAGAVFKRNWLLLMLLAVLFVGFSLFVYLRVRAWMETYLCVTLNRMIIIGWRRRRELTVIPIADAMDMVFCRPLLGRFLGHGTFIISASKGGSSKCKLAYLPYPEQLYVEVCGILFPDLGDASELRRRPQAGWMPPTPESSNRSGAGPRLPGTSP
jgi:hypothetical protein